MNEKSLLKVAAITHQGLVRKKHEDAIAIGQWVRTQPMNRTELSFHPVLSPAVCLVADGLGGQAGGEIASSYVAYRMAEEAPGLVDEDRAGACLCRINDELYDQMLAHEERLGMGSTVAGLIFTAGAVIVFNIGDSRVYCDRSGYLRQLTTDDAASSMEGNVGHNGAQRILTQALGGARERIGIKPHVISERAEVGRRYLICSDGLTDMVDLDTIETCLRRGHSAAVPAMLEEAVRRGGRDNISIVLVQIDEGDLLGS